MAVVAVVGASGFVGGECARALSAEHEVKQIRAPRLTARGRSLHALRADVENSAVAEFGLSQLAGVDVVVNAAGLATAGSNDLSALLGANTMLPWLLLCAARRAGVQRLVHVSSAAVQGRCRLDEGERLAPESPYGLSKALGEVLLRESHGIEVVRYRPTSVQGPSREVTRTLMKLAEAPVAAVASPGTDPTPQMPVSSVGRAMKHLVDLNEMPPAVVLHPWEGQTTKSLLCALGGREPLELPRSVVRAAVDSAFAVLPSHGVTRAYVWRLEMLMLGQRQSRTWLDGRIDAPDSDWVQSCRNAILETRRPS